MTDQPLEIWIAMDETGSWEIAKDEHDAFEALDRRSLGARLRGNTPAANGLRRVREVHTKKKTCVRHHITAA
jgi:hypothetical protein